METLALYLFKVHLAVALLYGLYYMTVRNELFFRLNRFILLGILIISFSLPLLPSFTFDTGVADSSGTIFTNVGGTDLIRGKEVGVFEDEVQMKRLYGVITSLLAFYLCGAGFFLLNFISQVLNVLKVIANSDQAFELDIKYRVHYNDIVPFSFFNSIVMNPDLHDREEFRQIIAHENAHSRQWHSIDILIAELANAILWGNPLVRSLKRSIRMNLEYLADQKVLSQGFDKKEYQWSILRPYLRQHAIPLTNNFGSIPKLRIEKMNAPSSSFIKLYKYAFLIPIIAWVNLAIAPLQASALNRIYAMHLIDEHEYRDYLGYYEFEHDKGSFVQILMKDDDLVMKTMWNNGKIYFQKQSESNFVDMQSGIRLKFPRNWDGTVSGLVAFGEDRWRKVYEYKPVLKKSSEGTVISRTASGGMQVMVYAVDPWVKVKHYTNKRASSP
ncbi:MAG TPA: M56 family metallopeptidase [Daejeonella sp.]|uniref:M56 family metallopeptidase n=1 Tax=Daejeonella sp. TaxID=2805397 RepID=UPI002ED7F94E